MHERRPWLRVALPSLVTFLILFFSIGRTWGNLQTWDLELRPENENWTELVVAVVILGAVLPEAIIKSRRSDH